MYVAWQSQHLILYTDLLSLSLTLVGSPRKVVISLCAIRILQRWSIRAMVSEVPLMYGIVAVVTGPELTLV